MAETDWDVVIIGAGLGGSALASRFVGSGLKIVLLERGGYLKTEPANWDTEEVISRGRYESDEVWLDAAGRSFHPRIYHNVGGSSKFFGGTAFRYRSSDFLSRTLPDGTRTAGWPVTYEDMAFWYDLAEEAMWVHGSAGSDPTEPERNPYPFPATEHEPTIADLHRRLEKASLRPFPLPVAVDQGPGRRCRKGSPCDGFPCRIRAKGDGENAFLRPALKADENIRVHTGIRVRRIVHDDTGRRVRAVIAEGPDGEAEYRGRIFVLAAGAAGSAALLLESASPLHPEGLANSSGMVGRNFMAHNNSVVMALRLFRKNPTRFQKTLAINDFYHPEDSPSTGASGNIQMRGKIRPENLANHPSAPVRLLRRFIAARSLDFWLMSEDAGLPENRLEPDADSRIRLHRRPSNMESHLAMVRLFARILRRSGYPLVLVRKPRLEAVQHLCGTTRFGTDPKTTVMDAEGKCHDLDNLYGCDAGLFPSSAAVNPALTVAANALRIGSVIRTRMSSHPPKDRRS